MKTIDILLIVGILIVLFSFIVVLISGPNMAYDQKQVGTKDNLKKYFPLISMILLVGMVLLNYFYKKYEVSSNTVQQYAEIKEIYNKKLASIDSTLKDSSLDHTKAEAIIQQDLDTLILQKSRLDSLERKISRTEKFIGKTKTRDSIMLLDKDYEQKIKNIEDRKKSKIYKQNYEK